MSQQQSQKLYVGNLNYEANEEQVRELFSGFGGVEEVKVIMDRFSGRSRGFAFVKMDSVESAGKAKEALSGQPFQGKSLLIDWAREEQQGGGGKRSFGGERRERSGEFRPRKEWGDRERAPRGERRERGNFYSR